MHLTYERRKKSTVAFVIASSFALLICGCGPKSNSSAPVEKEPPGIHADCSLARYKGESDDWLSWRKSWVDAMQACKTVPLEVECGASNLDDAVPPVSSSSEWSIPSKGLVRLVGTYDADHAVVFVEGNLRTESPDVFPCKASRNCVNLRMAFTSRRVLARECDNKQVVVEGWFDACQDGVDPGVLGEMCPRSIRAVKKK